MGFIILASSIGLGLFVLLLIVAHKAYYKREMRKKMAVIDARSKEVLKKQIRALLVRFERERLKEGEEGEKDGSKSGAQQQSSQGEEKQNEPLSEAEKKQLDELMGTLPDNLKAMQIFRADMKRRHGVYRKQLQDIYHANAPEKVQYVDTILENVEGDEEKFIGQLVKKYYPDGSLAKSGRRQSMRASSRAAGDDGGGRHSDPSGGGKRRAGAQSGALSTGRTRGNHKSTAGMGDDGCIVIDVGGFTMASGVGGGGGGGGSALGDGGTKDDGSGNRNSKRNSAAKIEMTETGGGARGSKKRPARKRKKKSKGAAEGKDGTGAAPNAVGTAPETNGATPPLVPPQGDSDDRPHGTDSNRISMHSGSDGSDAEFDLDPDGDGSISSGSDTCTGIMHT